MMLVALPCSKPSVEESDHVIHSVSDLIEEGSLSTAYLSQALPDTCVGMFVVMIDIFQQQCRDPIVP